MKKHTLKVLMTAATLSTAALVAVPAQAGPLGFIKKLVKQELADLAQDTIRSATDTATTGVVVAAGDVTGDGRPDTAERPFRQEGGTTVPTADDVQAPQEERAALIVPAIQKARYAAPRRGKLSQNGTTVPSAEDVAAPQRPQRARLVQNGTTVETAGEVQAPEKGD